MVWCGQHSDEIFNVSKHYPGYRPRESASLWEDALAMY